MGNKLFKDKNINIKVGNLCLRGIVNSLNYQKKRDISRSKTFPGISQAISSQYGEFVLNELSKN